MSAEISALVRRLEAATARLEEIAAIPQPPAANRAAAPPPPKSVPAPQAAAAVDGTVTDLQAVIDNKVLPCVDLARAFGDATLDQQVEIMIKAFQCHCQIVQLAPQAMQPATQQDAEGFRELSSLLMQANDLAQDNRRSPYFHHLKLLADSLQATTWIMNPEPADYIKSIVGDAQFWENKIRREFKESDPRHIAFVDANLGIYTALSDYAKRYFKKEMAWNSLGRPFSVVWSEFKSQASSAPASAPPKPTRAIPPPPPGAPAGMGALLGDIKSGRGPVPPPKPPKPPRSPMPPSTKPKPVVMRAKKPKRIEQNDDLKQIIVEYAENESEPINVEVPFGYSILVTDCKDATVILNGKANAVNVNQCTKLNLLVDTVVSSVGVVNSKSFKFQAKGPITAVQLDRVDTAELYINSTNTDASIVSSGCVGVNIVVLDPEDTSGDSVEVPLPEQFVTSFKGGKLVTEVYKHS